jgi:surface polysaccharide O-acyltransferase-like enzyme
MNHFSRTLSNKQEFIAIDYFKLIASFFVVAIHASPFESLETPFANFMSKSILAIAVPFFFITSGYFWSKKDNDKEKTFQFLKRLLIMYVIYTCIYIPLFIVSSLYTHTESVSSIIIDSCKSIFLKGWGHLWYLTALIISILILYLLNRIKGIKLYQIGIICLVLFLFGKLFPMTNLYQNNITVSAAFDAFSDTALGNCFFIGLLDVFIGYAIYKLKPKIKQLPYGILLIITMAFNVVSNNKYNVYVLPIVAALTFLTFSFIPLSSKYKMSGLHMRKISTLVYFWHGFFKAITGFLRYGVLGSTIQTPNYVNFLTVLILTLAFSELVLFLSKKQKLHWLKFLY